MTELPDRAAPYCGPAPEPGALLTAWNTDPVLGLVLLGALAAGLRGARDRRMFGLAWAGLVVAFVSPLCALTVALFSARAAHHLLLLGLIAPALAAARPLWGLPPGLGFALTAGALVAWHLPPVYAAAWDHAWIYWALQGALLLPAWAFWSGIVAPGARDDAEGLAVAAATVGALAGIMGLIGAVLTFADRLLYPEHLATAAAWGLDPLADQRLAGLVMWVPGLAPLAVVAALIAGRAWRRARPA